ncbi:SAM-dependent methyltransferase [Friedmanniella endophytica]|uniref:SAM-dependent methyltransferase n=1 Tax=Microlunatus kandeliicorticis TaxID=1759536 RepID=A0A7W3IRJ4_9ACTN|nr:class I SAM-dependent methyltransferase [Microlunatus kandeliicorticis]MBA8793954.1 SAM-dependent methyltransferase [Microlunatus kandeliicorticis]
MIDPLELYETGLCTGSGAMETATGARWALPIRAWSSEPDDGDRGLLDRCLGPTLDVGCGPGRLTADLGRRGTPALGVDISAVAVALTRARGGTALRRDVFGRMLGEHRWRHVLLADGNVGIGGDPIRMLWRCRDLLDPGGSVLLDVEPPGTGLRAGSVRLVDGERTSAWFAWAWLGADALTSVAAAAGLGVRALWQVTGASGPRWQAELEPSDRWPCR